jgi:hypothetical protein
MGLFLRGYFFFAGILMTNFIVKNFVTDFGAVADGTIDDSLALDRWLAWAQAQGTRNGSGRAIHARPEIITSPAITISPPVCTKRSRLQV